MEFRHHSGTIDSVKINNWLKLCHQIVVAAKNNKPVKKLDATRTGTRTLNHRFKVLMSGINITSDVKKFFGKRMRKFIREDGQPQTVQTNETSIMTDERRRSFFRTINLGLRNVRGQQYIDQIRAFMNDGFLEEAQSLLNSVILRQRRGQ